MQSYSIARSPATTFAKASVVKVGTTKQSPSSYLLLTVMSLCRYAFMPLYFMPFFPIFALSFK